MMILSIIYMSVLIVILVSGIVGAAIYQIDKNAERKENQ